jgi:hypothetical protein
MQSLASNPGGGIANQPDQLSNQDALGIVNQLKDREMTDFQKKANFMSDLSLRQEQRMRSLFDPNNPNKATTPGQPTGQPENMNVVQAQDPQAMTGYQKGELGIRQQDVNLDSQKLAQSGKLGQGALDIKQQQADLNQQKSDQINTTKQADMQRKIDESNQKIAVAQQALQQKTDNATAQLEAHKNLAAAMEERHKLELAQKDAQFQITSDQHQKAIDALQEKLKQSGHSTTTTEVNPDGTKKTVTTQRGAQTAPAPEKQPDGSYKVTAPDGSIGTIPADKLDDWMTNHHSGGGDGGDGGEDNQ